jgi:pimeloyl-ACP methyl ester carboxylesterase
MENPAIRTDIARFARGVKPAELLEISTRLDKFTRPVRIVWGEADRVFKPQLGQRLAETFSNASYIGVPGARTFVPIDAPSQLVAELRSFLDAGPDQASPPTATRHTLGTGPGPRPSDPAI